MTLTINAFVIDFDDTLAPCGVYYFSAMKKFADLAATRTGFDEAFCRQMLDAIDGGMLALPSAFNRDRFPIAFRAASVVLDAITGIEPDTAAAAEAFLIGDSVFSEPYPVYPGVRSALEQLKARGATLILNTKGDDEVQKRKVRINNLDGLFHHVYITSAKNVPYYERITKEMNLDLTTTAFVGDSMRDDIIAPNSIGGKTIFVSTKSPDEWKPKWSYEAKIDGPIDPTFWIRTFPEITTLPLSLPGD